MRTHLLSAVVASVLTCLVMHFTLYVDTAGAHTPAANQNNCAGSGRSCYGYKFRATASSGNGLELKKGSYIQWYDPLGARTLGVLGGGQLSYGFGMIAASYGVSGQDSSLIGLAGTYPNLWTNAPTGGSFAVRINALPKLTVNANETAVASTYLKLPTIDTADPTSADCDEASERGRMFVADGYDLLYFCAGSGWVGVQGNL
jgi:hypothetical protein